MPYDQHMHAQTLIEKHNRTFSSYYKGQLYTHTPMALLALTELGATKARLNAFYQKSIAKLEAKKSSALKITENNWTDYFGQQQAESAYIEFFQTEIERLGQEQMIAKYFDALLPGMGAAAFHPLIRLFYAVRFNIAQEVVISLATWASSYLDLALQTKIDKQGSLLDSLQAFQNNHFNKGKTILALNIAKRMQKVSRMSMFKELSTHITIRDLEPLALEENLLWLFSQNNNFTLLHTITAHHAFTHLQHFSDQPKQALILLCKALLAAYLSTTGTVNIDFTWNYPKLNLPEWEALKEKAIQSNDEHVIKLLHVLSLKKRENLTYQLKYAAALKLNLIAFKD